MIVLYVLFALSILLPVYTYALYPVVLKLFKAKKYKTEEIEPNVIVIVIGDNPDGKIRNIRESTYRKIEVLTGNFDGANKAKGGIVVFTDTKTELDLSAIEEIVKPFADERVGCVVGQQTNPEKNSAFWKYENLVKRLESRIGCVSGANDSIFAIRKSDMPEVPDKVFNKPFYIATKITENGKDVVFQNTARAYEEKTEGTNFQKHVDDAAGYWQALRLFPKMLIGKHGSFVYVSHRVMKWFVWLNMVMLLVTSGILGLNGSVLMEILFLLQFCGYILVVALEKKEVCSQLKKVVGIVYYFISLNIAYLLGLYRVNRK